MSLFQKDVVKRLHTQTHKFAMGLVCRKIVRNTFCSIPFVLGLTAGVFVYLHNSLGSANKGASLRSGHSTLSQVDKVSFRFEKKHYISLFPLFKQISLHLLGPASGTSKTIFSIKCVCNSRLWRGRDSILSPNRVIVKSVKSPSYYCPMSVARH